MAFDEGLVEWVRESLEPLGTVTLRKMMGGATLYLDGTIFAIVADDEIWFKADLESNAIWDEAGRERFTVTFSTGMVDTMNYRRAPTDVYDDAEAMREWAGSGSRRGCAPPRKKPKPAG
ncbi:MAG: TfoX/Sxy family protein [Sphingomonas sp.]